MSAPPQIFRRFVLASLVGLAGHTLSAVPARAQNPQPAIAMQGEPALPPDFSCLPSSNPDAKKGGALRLGALGAFSNLNPYGLDAGDAAAGLAGPVYESLMARNFDEPFSLYGLIAQTIETDDARSFVTFHLDPRARFSDGVPITSADVAFSFDLLRRKGRPQMRAAYGLVKSVATPDAQTISFDLAGADDRELPLILALMPVLPAHAMTEDVFLNKTLTPPLGSGPYRIEAVAPGQSLVLTRDKNYWAEKLPINCGRNNFDRIVFTYARDDNSLFEAFRAGLIDYRQETDPARWRSAYDFPARRDGKVAAQNFPLGGPKGFWGLAFNSRRKIFEDPRLREALATMFDFEWLNAHILGGLFTRTQSFFDDSDLSSLGRPASAAEKALLAPFPEAVRQDILAGDWRPPRSDGFGHDRGLAKKALEKAAEAGWRLKDGRLTRDGQALSFEILVETREQERIALYYSGALKTIGVEARVRLVDDSQFQSRRQHFDYDMIFALWQASASPGNEQRMRWGEGSAAQESSYNFAGARNPALDAIIAALVAAESREQLITAARALDRVLLSGFYAVPLYHAATQWTAYWRRLAPPRHVPRYEQPLFGEILSSWSQAPLAAPP